MNNNENKVLEGIVTMVAAVLPLVLILFIKKDPLSVMFMLFLCTTLFAEIKAVIEINNAKKKTFNGGRPYHPYRFMVVIMAILTLLMGVLKILEAAGIITVR